MASLLCPDCGTAVPWTAAGCPGCGVLFRQIQCAACKYVERPDRFVGQRCPRCAKDRLKVVPLLGEEIDVVGSEAFISDPTPDTPVQRRPSAGVTEESHATAQSITPAPGTNPSPSAPQPEPPSPHERSSDVPPPVLKRHRWTRTQSTSEEEATRQSAPASDPVVPSVRTSPREGRRLSFAVSPKTWQVLRLAMISIPIAIVVVGLIYSVASIERKPRVRVPESTQAADPGAVEAQAFTMLRGARDLYEARQVDEAAMTLQHLVSLYPLTQAAVHARLALERISQGKPPFADTPTSTLSSAPVEPPPADSSTAPGVGDTSRRKPFIGIPRGVVQTQIKEDSEQGTASSPSRTAPPRGSTLARSEATPRPLPDGFVAVHEAGVHGSGWPIEILCIKDQSHMQLVPSGEFEMGGMDGEPTTEPLHRVFLTTFYMDRYEITLLQYNHFLEQRRLKNNAYRSLSHEALAVIPSDRHPVVGLAWRDAQAYAEWSGKSLPTEAQWEKAARGTDGRPFPWGQGDPQWERPRASKQLDPVGSFAWDVSPYGCFDMVGNAWEWCSDWYNPVSYATSSYRDPGGPEVAPPPVSSRAPEKVIRGGAPTWDARWRGFAGIDEAPFHVGFRCVLEVERVLPRPPAPPVVEAPRQAPAPTQLRPPPGGYKF